MNFPKLLDKHPDGCYNKYIERTKEDNTMMTLYDWFRVYRREGLSPAEALYWAKLDPFE